MRRRARACASGVANVPAVIGVSTPPGHTQFARTPCAPYCTASESGERVDAALARGVARRRTRGRGSQRSTRSSRSIRRRPSSDGNACAMTANVPTRFTLQHLRTKSSTATRCARLQVGPVEDAGRGDDAADAARGPSTACATVSHHGRSSLTSHSYACARPPASCDRGRRRSRVLGVAVDDGNGDAAVARESRCAVARPMPLRRR